MLILFYGFVSGLALPPVYLLVGLPLFGVLYDKVKNSPTLKQALLKSSIFALGHFVANMYWVSFALNVYIEDFWWLIPFVLFGIPLILSAFIAVSCALSWIWRYNRYYQLIFCICWIFGEWLRSWLFTGLPWNLLGYSFSCWLPLIQSSSLISIYGLSFTALYISLSFYNFGKELHNCYCDNFTRKHFTIKNFWQKLSLSIPTKVSILISFLLITVNITYGNWRLVSNQAHFSPLTLRIVQPSIKQIAKWDTNFFQHNMEKQINLSLAPGNPDLIIWSEAALIIPYYHPTIMMVLREMLGYKKATLITGTIMDNQQKLMADLNDSKTNDYNDEQYRIYNSLVGLSENGEELFTYHKSHLVPFGEYVPLKEILPLQKITAGSIDYTPGNQQNIVNLNVYSKFLEQPINLKIKPLICYEAIFPSEVRVSNQQVDLLVNITNDAWYGYSSGPFQHFEISRMRAIESGIPMVRAANNGISAVIDPIGRIIASLPLNAINIIDSRLPIKLHTETLYSKIGDFSVLLIISVVLLLTIIFQQIFEYYKNLSLKSKP